MEQQHGPPENSIEGMTNGHRQPLVVHTNGNTTSAIHIHQDMHFDNGDAGSSSDATGASLDDNYDGLSRLGTCKWFNVLKGFGFIIPNDGTPEVFVHQSVLKMPGFRSLEEGAAVEFRSKETERGWEATHVAGAEGSDCQGSSVRPLGKRKHKKIRCFNCGQYGNHIASKCKLGLLPKSCYECKGEDHLVSQCPNRTQKENHSNSSSDKIESDETSSTPPNEA